MRPTSGANEMRLKIVLEPSEDGGYTAHVPALPGCNSEGKTLDEARANIREAIELWLEPDDQFQAGIDALVEEVVV
jgi:predicted RNase H-like HicB family nuclease